MNLPSNQQGGDPAEGRQGGESSIQRLKRQKREAEDQVNHLSHELKQIKAEIANMRQGMNGNSQPASKGNDRDGLMQIILDDEGKYDERTARMALLKLVELERSETRETVKKELLGEMTTNFTRQNQLNTVTQQIRNMFGEDAVSPDSQHYQIADILLSRSGVENPTPEQIKLAFYEADHRIRADSKPQKEQPPPQEAMAAQAPSKGTAEYVAERDAALARGDTAGATRAIAEKLFAD